MVDAYHAGHDLAPLSTAAPIVLAARFLAVGGYDNTVRMLSLEDGTQLRAVATQAVTVGAGCWVVPGQAAA